MIKNGSARRPGEETATAFHELSHATDHTKRLRDSITEAAPFGSATYASEADDRLAEVHRFAIYSPRGVYCLTHGLLDAD